jgi:hypothetical protein
VSQKEEEREMKEGAGISPRQRRFGTIQDIWTKFLHSGKSWMRQCHSFSLKKPFCGVWLTKVRNDSVSANTNKNIVFLIQR